MNREKRVGKGGRVPLNLMFALNLWSISELLVKKSERANCENRCRGNNILDEQRY